MQQIALEEMDEFYFQSKCTHVVSVQGSPSDTAECRRHAVDVEHVRTHAAETCSIPDQMTICPCHILDRIKYIPILQITCSEMWVVRHNRVDMSQVISRLPDLPRHSQSVVDFQHCYLSYIINTSESSDYMALYKLINLLIYLLSLQSPNVF
jgi:hypothetical protein